MSATVRMADGDSGHDGDMDTAIAAFVTDRLPAHGPILTPSPAARALGIARTRMRADALTDLPAAAYAGAVLIDDELSRAGEHAEGLIDEVGTALEPGGILVATARNRIHAEAVRRPLQDLRGFSAAEVEALLNHRGFVVDVVCAPGAAARLRGEQMLDIDADRQPGLIDAAPSLLLIARAPRSADERGRVFHDTRPRKIAAAATLCRDPAGRLLVVHDTFKRAWTIPGGVVDADEDPAAAARRESWEEAGVKVDTGRLLGVFASRWPDRLVFVFAATPAQIIEHPEPVHAHEISAVAWLPLDEALTRLAPTVAFKVRTCLNTPGLTWVQ